MKDIVEYLDRIGHKLGIGGFEGVIGALVLSLAALVIVTQSFSLLKGTEIEEKQPRIQRDGHIHNPLEWSEDPEKTIGWDRESNAIGPKLILKLCLIGMGGGDRYLRRVVQMHAGKLKIVCFNSP